MTPQDVREAVAASGLTREQQAFVLAVLVEGHNASVRAVPGAGKSRALEILADLGVRMGRNVMAITYSATMKEEWRLKLGRNRAHSFDSMCKWVFNIDGPTTASDMQAHLARGSHPASLGIDLLLIDEAQDMTPLHRRFLQRYAAEHGTVQLAVVGDERQVLFTFHIDPECRADSDMLVHAPVAFAGIADARRPWSQLRFTLSFRLTSAMTPFLHTLFSLQENAQIRAAGELRDAAHTDGGVHYYCADLFKDKIAEIISKYAKHYGPANTLIITPNNLERSEPDGKGGSVAIRVIRRLKRVCGHIHVAYASDGGSGNLRVFTPCQAKGLTVDCVIVLGADSFSTWVTQPQWFVALTRARARIVVFHNCKNDLMVPNHTSLDWLRTTPGAKLCQLAPFCPSVPAAPRPRCTTVTELVAEPGPGLLAAVAAVAWAETAPSRAGRRGPARASFTHADGTFEPCVADLYGIAVGMLVELDHGVPSAYARIFAPVLLRDAPDNFLDLVHDMPARAAEAARVLRAAWRGTDHAALEILRDYGLTRQDGTGKLVRSAGAARLRELAADLLGPELAGQLITEHEYAMRFPPEVRDVLAREVPLHGPWTAAQAVRAACATQAFDGSHHRVLQIPHYDWVDGEFVDSAAHRLRAALGEWETAEDPVDFGLPVPIQTRRPAPVAGIVGRVDFVSAAGLVEVKVRTSHLTDTDRAQLLVYAHMRRATGVVDPRYVLFNAADGQCLEFVLHTTPEESARFLADTILAQMGEP